MMLALTLAFGVPCAAGYLMAGVLRVGPGSDRPSPLLRVCLGLGWGLGIASCAFFLWRALGGEAGRAFLGADLALFACLASGAGLAARANGDPGRVGGPARGLPRFASTLLVVSLVVALGVWVAEFFVLSWQRPQGAWDALAIWNLRARFLYLGGVSRGEAFHPALLASHLDYPLLIPATVARCWAYAGGESTAAPILVAFAFAIALVGLLPSALAALRGRSQGLLGCVVLLATPSLVELGSMQYADIPLAYFFLATAAALVMGDRAADGRASSRWAATAGMMGGFAAWTKNEGLLFLGSVVASRLLLVVPSKGWGAARREAVGFAIGLAPILAVLVAFKVYFAPSNDFLAEQTPVMIVAKLTDPSRYALVGRAIAGQVPALGSGAVAWLIAYRLLLGGAPRRAGGAFAWLVLALMSTGYVLVYVSSPLFLPWHLQWSLDRLIIHLWPLAVFAFFLSAATPEEALGGARGARGPRP